MSISDTCPRPRCGGEEPWYKRRTIWRDVPMSQWRDWHWQMRNRITTAEELARVMPMTPREQRTIERALDRFRFAVPPYYASLIDPDDPECPIRLQAVPGEGELAVGDFDIEDPLNEDGDAVAPGMTHRYPDRVLWVIMHECAMLCRHCTRKRKVGERPDADQRGSAGRGDRVPEVEPGGAGRPALRRGPVPAVGRSPRARAPDGSATRCRRSRSSDSAPAFRSPCRSGSRPSWSRCCAAITRSSSTPTSTSPRSSPPSPRPRSG